MATADFRSIYSDTSSTATAQGAYIQLYTDYNGDYCVMTVVKYKIISNYSRTTVHNMTKGTTIVDPDTYYNNMADRYYGNSKLFYLKQATCALEMEIKAQKSGRYVNASYLSLGVY